MFGTVIDVFGTFTFSLGWLILIYGLWRNQRSAKKSPLVDGSNFGPRVGAIVEVVLHPDHAAKWLHPNGRTVFPALGQDSSEVYGIRDDDGKAT
jgi:hypothetical protein